MANPASNISLNSVIPLTLRRGQPYSERPNSLDQRLAILNFGASGPYALDGVLPVFFAALASEDQSKLATRFKFNLDADQNTGEDTEAVDGGPPDGPVVTWKRLFSQAPDVPADYTDVDGRYTTDRTLGVPLRFFGQEVLKIYGSLLGMEFEENNSTTIDSDKSIVAFASYVGGANTNTRETFVRDLNEQYEVAGFTTVSVDHMPGQHLSNTFDPGADTYYPKGRFAESDVALDINAAPWMRLLSFGFKSLVHEMGHVLGLTHPGKYDGNLDTPGWELWTDDNWNNSLMSYVAQPKAYEVFRKTQGFDLLNLTPRTLDLLALDEIYGQQKDSRGNTFGTQRAFPGDTTFGFNTNITDDQSIIYANLDKLYDHRIATTIADGSGIDTIDASGFEKGGNTIDLYVMTGEETTSRLSMLNGTIGNLSLAVGTVIENAIGGEMDDKFFDNEYRNKFIGNGGNDWFAVSGGKDKINGGSGYDRVVIQGEESDFIIKNKSTSKKVVHHKKDSNYRVNLRGVEEIIFGSPVAAGMETENRGGQLANADPLMRANTLLSNGFEDIGVDILGIG